LAAVVFLLVDLALLARSTGAARTTAFAEVFDAALAGALAGALAVVDGFFAGAEAALFGAALGSGFRESA
jgi:hypothetical protein